MSNLVGTSGAFQQILQKMDETFIQAEFCYRQLLEDANAEEADIKSANTIVPQSPAQSERSCSPVMPRAASSTTVSRASSSVKAMRMKSKGLVSLDGKKVVILTSFKSNSAIPEKDVKTILKIVEDLFPKKDVSSASDSSSASFMTL